MKTRTLCLVMLLTIGAAVLAPSASATGCTVGHSFRPAPSGIISVNQQNSDALVQCQVPLPPPEE